MCGRYVVAYDPETLVSGFSVTRVTPFPRRWNVAPQSPVPVIFETKDGERVAELMRWGLVPHWARDAATARHNARAEGVFEKPSFRQAARRRRCLLPASGFYEWQATQGSHNKQPWYFSASNAPLLAMAGLFEAWRPGPQAEWLLTCCVITVGANALMAPIHDRMPALLTRDQWAGWLNRAEQDPAALNPLLTPCAPAALQVWPVARAVGRSTADGAALIEPLFGAT